MHTLIEEYIQKPIEQRKAHINLCESCLEIGGNSQEFRGLLAHYLLTTIPKRKGYKVCLCHACNNDKCSNPKHLYWGTYKENCDDAVTFGSNKGVLINTIQKYGKDAYKQFTKVGGHKSGLKQKGVPKTKEHKSNLSKSLMSHSFNGNRFTKVIPL